MELGGKFLGKRNLHHGTLLLDADLAAMQSLLSPHVLKMQSKGVDSVRARVCNLASLEPGLSHTDLVSAIAEAFLEAHEADFGRAAAQGDFGLGELSADPADYHGLLRRELPAGAELDSLVQSDEVDARGFEAGALGVRNTAEEVFAHPLLAELARRSASRAWVLGEAPRFSNNVEFKNEAGFFDVYYEAERGAFAALRVFSDCLFPDLIEAIEQFFADSPRVPCGREGVSQARAALSQRFAGDPHLQTLLHSFCADFEASFE